MAASLSPRLNTIIILICISTLLSLQVELVYSLVHIWFEQSTWLTCQHTQKLAAKWIFAFLWEANLYGKDVPSTGAKYLLNDISNQQKWDRIQHFWGLITVVESRRNWPLIHTPRIKFKFIMFTKGRTNRKWPHMTFNFLKLLLVVWLCDDSNVWISVTWVVYAVSGCVILNQQYLTKAHATQTP